MFGRFGLFVYSSAACRMLIVEIAGANERAEKADLTEPCALDSAGRRSRNQASVVAGWRWSSPVAALTLDQLWTMSGSE